MCFCLVLAIVLRDNLIQFPGLASPLIHLEGSPAGYRLSGNTYVSRAGSNRWFTAGKERKGMALQELAKLVAEAGASSRDTRFPDRARTVEAYDAHCGGKASLGDFITRARRQFKGNWRRGYTAAAVNDWIRAGFGMKREALTP
jgi:hypothetical protein